MGPLQGIRIIDLTTVLMGPFATQMLGDYGADVIKVKSPEGDVIRQIGPTRHPGMGSMFLNSNRSKRSVCLDLKKEAGRDALLRLTANADALIYNVRPQAMERLRLGYDVVSKVNPRLIYAGAFGFGQDGPYAAKPAYDDLIQGGSALAHLMARGGDGRRAMCRTRWSIASSVWRRSARSARALYIARRPGAASVWIFRCSRPWSAS